MGFWAGTVDFLVCWILAFGKRSLGGFDVGGVGRDSTNSKCLNAMQSYRSQVAAWG